MVKPFEDAAFALEKGTYTKEPVKSDFGWHVIKLEDRRKVQPPSFEDVRSDIEQEVTTEIIGTFVAELRKGATIERFNADGSNRDKK